MGRPRPATLRSRQRLEHSRTAPHHAWFGDRVVVARCLGVREPCAKVGRADHDPAPDCSSETGSHPSPCKPVGCHSDIKPEPGGGQLRNATARAREMGISSATNSRRRRFAARFVDTVSRKRSSLGSSLVRSNAAGSSRSSRPRARTPRAIPTLSTSPRRALRTPRAARRPSAGSPNSRHASAPPASAPRPDR